jgi:hypothetical protein
VLGWCIAIADGAIVYNLEAKNMRTSLIAAALLFVATTGMTAAESLVSVGSPTTPFPPDKQNEPSIAVDPAHPSVLAAGANEEIDIAPCSGSDCSFTPGVGTSGIYFSFNGGSTWVQPTYTGWSARTGTPATGPIGTLPWYYESGLISDGDPVLAFGPRRGSNGQFSWSNGSRLYYLNLAANFSSTRTDRAFKGFEAIAVSRTDDVAAAAAGVKDAWLPPVIVSSRTSSTTFSDKDGLWADTAASSPYFGNLYVCWTSFRSIGSLPEPIVFSRSTDGGDSWSAPKQLTEAANPAAGGRQSCTIRTDSIGAVYVFFEGAAFHSSVQMMVRSFDGGNRFERPTPVAVVRDVGAFDANQSDFTIDGIGGARTNSYPSVDIANGAPTGAGATNRIVMAWGDARNGLNSEQALVQYSSDRGETWSTPANAAEAGDRPNFPAIAISPNGQTIYMVYEAFLGPWQTTTASSRQMQGVVRKATWPPAVWASSHRGAIGDARASSANALDSEFLGDYSSVAATNTFGVAVWTDVRNSLNCPAVDAYRQALTTSNPLPKPAPPTQCPPTFGNTDIFSVNVP